MSTSPDFQIILANLKKCYFSFFFPFQHQNPKKTPFLRQAKKRKNNKRMPNTEYCNGNENKKRRKKKYGGCGRWG
jgi:hypothetical protein